MVEGIPGWIERLLLSRISEKVDVLEKTGDSFQD
jgi:hypothetical protein